MSPSKAISKTGPVKIQDNKQGALLTPVSSNICPEVKSCHHYPHINQIFNPGGGLFKSGPHG